MLVLALDTATRAGSCAIARGGNVLVEAASDTARPQASRLPGELMAILDRLGVGLAEIDVYAVAAGPGSFTGLRVGIATMQGLAFAAGKPLLGVSAFDALAHAAAARRDSSGPDRPAAVATWIDAWRGEIYAALYDDERQIAAPTVATPGAILDTLHGRPVVFTGDGAETFRAQIHAALGPQARLTHPPAPLLAGAIAHLAWKAVSAGHRPAPDAIRPLYVRRPDAELARDARDHR